MACSQEILWLSLVSHLVFFFILPLSVAFSCSLSLGCFQTQKGLLHVARGDSYQCFPLVYSATTKAQTQGIHLSPHGLCTSPSRTLVERQWVTMNDRVSSCPWHSLPSLLSTHTITEMCTPVSLLFLGIFVETNPWLESQTHCLSS